MAIEIKLKKSKKNEAKHSLPRFQQKKISGTDRMFFTERLGLLLETGGALLQNLQSIQEQTDNIALAKIVGDLAKDVEAGKSFSLAMARHPEMFSSTYVNLISASENGGFMHKVLKELQSMEAKREKLNAMLFSSLSYPGFLIIFSTIVIFFILLVIFPKFSKLFAPIRDQLPFTTLFLMAVSDILKKYWIFIIISMTGLFMGVSRWIQSPSGRKTIDGLKLKAPVLKNIIIELYLVQVFRVMGLSLNNGVSVVDALRSCRDVINNSIFRRFMMKLENQVAEGKGLASGFERMEVIPSMTRQMIRTGEDSGNLALVMERIADFYEYEIEKKISIFSKMIEPIMLLAMGAVVGLMVSSLILPIFKLSSAMR